MSNAREKIDLKPTVVVERVSLASTPVGIVAHWIVMLVMLLCAIWGVSVIERHRHLDAHTGASARLSELEKITHPSMAAELEALEIRVGKLEYAVNQ